MVFVYKAMVLVYASSKIEFENRIAAAWAAFHKHKHELCGKAYTVQNRMKLFNAIVTPTILYGCAAWALTRHQEEKLLRYVLRLFRKRFIQEILRIGFSI